MTSDRRRLHRAAVFASTLGQLRALALPVLVLFFVGGGGLGSLLVYGIAGAAVATIGAMIEYSTTEWWVTQDAVRLRTGFFSEKIVTVPLDRVQAIDTVRGPAQRLLGAVELHVQTAGGGARGEIVLTAVAPEVAEELREHVRTHGGEPAAAEAEEADAPAWRLGLGGLVVAALTSGSLGVLVPVVAAGSQVLDDVLGADEAERLLPDTAQEWAIAVLAVLAVAWILSVLGTIVAFAGFRVARDGDRIRIRRGIVERREASVPVARIAAIRIVESPLREPFGLAQVRIESAGYAKEPATAQALLPLVRRRDVDTLVRHLLPELAGGGDAREGADAPEEAGASEAAPALERPPRRALRRYVLPPAAAGAVVPLVLVPLVGTPALPALALPLLGAAFGAAAYRSAGWRLDGDRLVLRRRDLQRTTLVADAHRLPELITRTSPFQRRARLATLGVAVASGRRGRVAHLEAGTARDLLDRLTRTATAPR